MLSRIEVAGLTREPDCLMVATAAGDVYGADAVIVATGSRYRRLGVPGEAGLIGRGVHYCATCDGPFYRGANELVVIGGGNSALEESLSLTTLADRVTILTRGDLRASDVGKDVVRLDCELGFMLSLLKPSIEAEVHKQFDKYFGKAK